MLFQVSTIADNDRGPRYAEAVLNSFHETNRQRQWVSLELGSNQSTVGLFVRVPAGLVATFTHDFADAFPGCALTALPEEVRDTAGRILSATLRLTPDVFPLKPHRQFEDLLHRELADPLAGFDQSNLPIEWLVLNCRMTQFPNLFIFQPRATALRAVNNVDQGFGKRLRHFVSPSCGH